MVGINIGMKIKFMLLILFVYQTSIAQNGVNNWENPNIFGINKVEPYAHFVSFENKKYAWNVQNSPSEYRKSLNGIWKFQIVKNTSERLVDFYKADFNTNQWKDIPVPSNWECEGGSATFDCTVS